MANNIIYSDFNTGFVTNPITGDLLLVTNENSVKQSITNLVNMNIYEVPFAPTLGSSVRRALFENPSPVTQANLIRYITEVITNFESRAQLMNVSVQQVQNNRAYIITIIFYCKVTATQQTLNFPLTRVR